MSFIASEAARMAARLHHVQRTAPAGSAAARLLASAAANVALKLVSQHPPGLNDKELQAALARYELRDPGAFAPPGTSVSAPERLAASDRERIAKMTAEQKLALANTEIWKKRHEGN